MKPGDIVKPTQVSRFQLRSGSSWYPDAVVVMVEPLILVSRDGDMRWSSTVRPEYFEVCGRATKSELKVARTRLED